MILVTDDEGLDEEGVDALMSGLRDRLVGNEPAESLPEYVPKGAAIVEAAAEAPGVSAGSGRIVELVRGLQSHVHAGAHAAPLGPASVAVPACMVGGLGGLCNSVRSVGGVGGVGLQGNQDGPGVRLPPLKAVLGKVVAIH